MDSAIIITPQKLTTFLRYPDDDPVSQDSTDLAEEVALGWLSEATGIDDWSDPYGPARAAAVRSWVLELAAIAYENPTSMTQDSSGEVQSSWADRRKQILEAAERWALSRGLKNPGTALALSRGSFPPAQPWPDPGRGRW